jgi:hypothetical protein
VRLKITHAFSVITLLETERKVEQRRELEKNGQMKLKMSLKSQRMTITTTTHLGKCCLNAKKQGF